MIRKIITSLLLLDYSVLGFQENGTIDCGGIFTDRVGEVQSPSFSKPLPSNLDCSWIINGTRTGDLVALKFDAFSINDTESIDCSKTYVEISNYGTRGVRFCDDRLPSAELDSESNIVKIRLVTSAANHTHSKGFILRYVISQKLITTTVLTPKSVPTIPTCGGVFTAAFSEVESPLFPKAQSNLNCIWKINGKMGDYIELAFNKVDINDDSKQCKNNYITFGDVIHGHTLPRYCNHNKPTLNFISSTPNVFIKLVTDDGAHRSPGFSAVYQMYSGNGSIVTTSITTAPFTSTPTNGKSSASNNTGKKVAIGVIVSLLLLIFIVDLYNCRRQKGVIYYGCTKRSKHKHKKLYSEL